MESQAQMQMNQQNIIVPAMKQRVALFISCRNLKNLDIMSKSDPQVEVFLKDRTSGWALIGKTERINNNLNPDFSTFIECDYYFEKEQHIKFMVYDIDNEKGAKDYVGVNETTIGKIIGSNKQTYVNDLLNDKNTTSRGKIIVRLDNVNQSNDEARMKISANLTPFATLCCAGINNPYYIISRARSAENMDEFVRIYKSQNMVNNTRPIWNPNKLKISQICNGDLNLPIKIEVYSQVENGRDELYGEAKTTLNQIKSGTKQFNLTNKNKNGGTISFDQFTIFEMPNFMEYLRSGWAVNMSFAIDFTASNGELIEANSLHWQDPSGRSMNQYEQALLAVGKVTEPYALNQQFATFGFGGIPRYMGAKAPSHCFNLNGQSNPQIIGFQNVFNAYKFAINQTGLAGPTYFSHILKALLAYVQQCLQFQMYHCLLILTDGDIHDMSETTDLIVQLSKFPVSIIIVGVGNEEFEKMKFLDSDDKVLRNKQGQAAARDIVQFVRFQDYRNSDISILAEEVLREMPDQIVGYMMANGIKPQKQDWLNVDAAVQSHQQQ
eukprot:403356292